MFKIFGIITAIAILIFGILFFYPGILFKNKTSVENIIVYSDKRLNDDARAVVKKAYDKLLLFKLFKPSQKYEIYIAKSLGQYSFFAFNSKNTYECFNPLTGKIFIAKADFKKKKSFAKDSNVGRSLPAVIVKGIVLKILKDNLGLFKYLSVNQWKKQGIAEHIANEEGLYLANEACDGKKEISFINYRYKLGVEILMIENNSGVENLLRSNNSFESVKNIIRRRYCE